MNAYKPALFALFLAISGSAAAAPLLFLKGDKLYTITSGTDYDYVTSGVTKVVAKSSLFLKNDRLYRYAGGTSYEYITQQVTEICDDANYLVKQGSKLYALDASYETDYVTAGVTSCSSK